jgi:predicted nucleic acid-binding Zn ribbon protein
MTNKLRQGGNEKIEDENGNKPCKKSYHLVKRRCIVCGKKFFPHDYDHRKTCSFKCSQILMKKRVEKYYQKNKKRIKWNKKK